MPSTALHQPSSAWRARLRFHSIPIGVLFLVVLISYPLWFMHGNYGYDDLTRLNVPQRILLAWFYRNGHWPLWNPFNFAGQPFLAAGQSGPLYIPNIFYLMSTSGTAMKLSYLFHECVTVYGTYLAAFHLTRHRFSSVLSAVSFTTCGFFVGHQIHTQMFDAMSWLPLCFWLSMCVAEYWTRTSILALGCAFATQIYAGHPQVTFYTSLLIGLYLLIVWLRRPQRQGLIGIAYVFAGLCLGLGLSAAQWLPTVNLVTYSSRDAVSKPFLLSHSMSWQGLLQLISPFTAGAGTNMPMTEGFLQTYGTDLFWEYTCYTGIITLVLALAAVIRKSIRSAQVLALSITGLIALFLCVGGNGFLDSVLVNVPGFDLFRVPARYIGIVDFCVAMLAGMAFAELCSGDRQGKHWWNRWVPIIAVGAMASIVIAKGSNQFPLLQWTAVILTCLYLAVVILVLVLPRIRGSRWSMPLLGCLAMADCIVACCHFSPFALSKSPVSYTQASPPVAYIKQHLPTSMPLVRVADLGANVLSADMSAAYQIPSLNGYDSLVPAWYDDEIQLTWDPYVLLQQPRSLLDALAVKYVITDEHWNPLMITSNTNLQSWSHWFTLSQGTQGMAIRLNSLPDTPLIPSSICSITLTSGNHAFTKVIYGTTDTEYYIPLPDGWPTAAATKVTVECELWSGSFFLKDIRFTGPNPSGANQYANIQEALGPVQWKKVFTDGHTIIWENPDAVQGAWVAPNPESALVNDGSRVELTNYEPNKQSWSVTRSAGGMFMLSQMYDPNWKATVDGVAVRPVQVSVKGVDVLTGIPISTGTHHITVTYQPPTFATGLAISVLSSLVALALLLRSLLSRRTAN